MLGAVVVVAAISGCSMDLQPECEPAPEAMGARAELTLEGEAVPVGEEQEVTVRFYVDWDAGELYPQDIGDSCVEAPAGEEALNDFDVAYAQCDGGGCEVISVSEVLYQQQREIRVRLTRPTAKLTVRLKRSPDRYAEEIPDAIGEIALTAAP